MRALDHVNLAGLGSSLTLIASGTLVSWLMHDQDILHATPSAMYLACLVAVVAAYGSGIYFSRILFSERKFAPAIFALCVELSAAIVVTCVYLGLRHSEAPNPIDIGSVLMGAPSYILGHVVLTLPLWTIGLGTTAWVVRSRARRARI